MTVQARDITTVMRTLHPRPVRLRVRDISLPGHRTQFLLWVPDAPGTRHDSTWLGHYLARHLTGDPVTVTVSFHRLVNRRDGGRDREYAVTIGGECSRCGKRADHLTAWEGQRLCKACTDRYFEILEAWHDTLPVTVGRGVTTPGHVQHYPRLSLAQLDEWDATGRPEHYEQ